MDFRIPQDEDPYSGVERDGAPLAQLLAGGTSVVVVGTLGSGKSHLLRDVIRHLNAIDVDPVIVRSGAPLSHLPESTLSASPDPRARRIADGSPPEGARPIVIVDDAQELDAASAGAIVRAVYSGYATALFAVTVARDGRTPDDPDHGAAQLAIELWLRGLAERIDLAEMTPDEADELVTQFGGADFDTLTRATVVGLADGSRMLLRELAAEATVALRQGRDPLAAIRETPAHGRLADVLEAHLSQLPEEHRLTLAVLNRLHRASFADAVRIVPRDVVEELISARLVYDDGTPDRRLTANAALGRAADRGERARDARAALGAAMARMLTEHEEWWSAPLAERIADGWHRGEAWAPAEPETPDELRLRVALDAARLANDIGETDLAAAYARHGLRVSDRLELRLELAYAEATLGAPVDLNTLAGEIDVERLSGATLLRWILISSSLPYDGPELPRTADPLPVASPGGVPNPEFELVRGQLALLLLDFASSGAIGEDLATRPSVSTSVRMRAAASAAFSHGCLGSSQEAQRWFTRSHRLSGDRAASTALPSVDRLWALSLELSHHEQAGTDPRPTIERLEAECIAVAMEAEEATLSIAGLVVAVAYAAIGDAARAVSEFRSAIRRVRLPVFASWAAMVAVTVARTLALSEQASAAREVLDLADPALLDRVPLFAHARLVAESCVHATTGEREEARSLAREAAQIAEHAPALLARDVFQLIALGEHDDLLLAKLSRLADATSLPAVSTLSDRARELVDERRAHGGPPLPEAVRLSAIWGTAEAHRDWARRINVGQPATRRHGDTAHGDAALDLTRREREIALLVAEGLSNREIATRLYLSVRTVESHIYQARAKVDAHTRGDLGRFVAQQARTTPRGRRIGR